MPAVLERMVASKKAGFSGMKSPSTFLVLRG
jgi:hypothetical protein